MQKKQIPTRFLQRCRIGRLLLTACLLLATLLLALLGSIRASYADVAPGGIVSDPVKRAVDIAEPAVVRILTASTGHLVVHFPSGDVSFPRQGPGYQLTFSGSGTFITAHGDILTADHVVNPPAQDPGIAQAFEDAAAQDVTQYGNQHNIFVGQPTADQVDQALRDGQISSTVHIDSNQSTVYLSTSYTGPLTASSLDNLPSGLSAQVDNIEKESAFDQKDVAIIHVAFNDMASVSLEDSSGVQQQDDLTIIGFPGNGDISNRPTDFLTTSVNKITVSSIKTTDNGAPVIQVGGDVEHGDSGGPALDSTGSIVGIVSFGLVSADSPGTTAFLQASNSARDLLQSLNLDTTPGAFQQAWSQAFTDYAAATPGHWHKASSEFQKIAASYPLFKGITPYLNYAQTQAASEKLPTAAPRSNLSNSLLSIALTAIVVVLLIVLAVLLVRVARRRGKQASGPAQYPNTINTPTTLNGQALAPPMQMPPIPMPPIQTPPTLPPSSADTTLGDISAFGAPVTPLPPAHNGQNATPPMSSPDSDGLSSVLRPWPCGHLNRSNARFCSICGEPSPIPPMRQVEQ